MRSPVFVFFVVQSFCRGPLVLAWADIASHAANLSRVFVREMAALPVRC
jgi:hypothetical protein